MTNTMYADALAIVKAAEIPAVFLFGFRHAVLRKAADNLLSLAVELLKNLLLLSQRTFQALAVAAADVTGNVMDCPHRHQASPVQLKEALSQHLLKLTQRNPGVIYFPVEDMDLRTFPDQKDIQHKVCVQRDFLSLRGDFKFSFLLQLRHLVSHSGSSDRISTQLY